MAWCPLLPVYISERNGARRGWFQRGCGWWSGARIGHKSARQDNRKPLGGWWRDQHNAAAADLSRPGLRWRVQEERRSPALTAPRSLATGSTLHPAQIQ